MSDTDAPEAVAPDEDQGSPGQTAARNPSLSWTIKGMELDRREAITRAARRHSDTVAEFVWMLYETWLEVNRAPLGPIAAKAPPVLNGANLPAVIEANPVPAGANQRDTVEWLIDAVGRFCAVEAAPGNKTLQAEGRRMLARIMRAMDPKR
jgi:hypothetical protein